MAAEEADDNEIDLLGHQRAKRGRNPLDPALRHLNARRWARVLSSVLDHLSSKVGGSKLPPRTLSHYASQFYNRLLSGGTLLRVVLAACVPTLLIMWSTVREPARWPPAFQGKAEPLTRPRCEAPVRAGSLQ